MTLPRASTAGRLMPRRRRFIALGIGLLACAAVPGCGASWEADTHPASGRITVNGAPPVGALVQLQPVGAAADVRQSRPWGLVGADGRYELSTYELGDGAPAGQYKLTLTWPPDASVPSLADRLGGRYARPEPSPWAMTIAEGPNELPPVIIEDAEVDMTLAPMASGPAAGDMTPPGRGPGRAAR